MKFTVPAGHKAGACCADESQTRYPMQSAMLFRGSRTFVISTDARTLSAVPVESEGDLPKPALVPPEAVKAGAKDLTVEVNGEVRTTSGKKTEVYPLPANDGRWPALRQAFPAKMEKYQVLSLDAKLLAKLASAISPDGLVTLFISKKAGAAVGVVGVDETGKCTGAGLIMPLDGGDMAARREYFEKVRDEMPNESLVFKGGA